MEPLKSKKLAVIREAECIGCTKCIQACPVDAILGSSQLMHTVITDECIGCKLCIAPCPVDCIDMIALPQQAEKPEERKQKVAHIQNRYRTRQERLQQLETAAQNTILSESDKKNYLQAALLRVKART